MQVKDQPFGLWVLYLSFGTCYEVKQICDVACQNQAFVAPRRTNMPSIHYYDVFGKECVLCSTEQAVVLTLCKITEPRKRKLKVEILHD